MHLCGCGFEWVCEDLVLISVLRYNYFFKVGTNVGPKLGHKAAPNFTYVKRAVITPACIVFTGPFLEVRTRTLSHTQIYSRTHHIYTLAHIPDTFTDVHTYSFIHISFTPITTQLTCTYPHLPTFILTYIHTYLLCARLATESPETLMNVLTSCECISGVCTH